MGAERTHVGLDVAYERVEGIAVPRMRGGGEAVEIEHRIILVPTGTSRTFHVTR